MAVVIAPGPFGAGYQAFDDNGVVLAGGTIDTYLAGTSTPAATYTTSGGTIANSNPIVLDSDGRTPAEIWLTAGSSYKFVLKDSLGNTLGTFDNLPGINDATALVGTITTGALPVIPVYLGGTGQTTTNAALDALHTSQATVTSAASLNLGAVSSQNVRIVGNTAITSITLPDGWERTALFVSTVAISSNASLILPGGTTITAVSGDMVRFIGNTAGIVRAWVELASGLPIASRTGTQASTFTFNGSGGTSGSVTMTFLKIGNMVVLNIPAATATSGTGSTTFTSDTALPASILPAMTQKASFNDILNNGASTADAGTIVIGTNGILTIQREGSGTAWTNTSTCGMVSPMSITYFVG